MKYATQKTSQNHNAARCNRLSEHVSQICPTPENKKQELGS